MNVIVKARAAVAHLLLRFRTRHHLHTGYIDERFANTAIQKCIFFHLPSARSAGFKRAATFNRGVAFICTFVFGIFDLPPPSQVLNQHAGIAAIEVNHTAVKSLLLLLRRNKETVDVTIQIFPVASKAADEYELSPLIVSDNSLGLRMKS